MVARPNNPGEKVRELQRQLWTCAKRSRSRRFHALYDRIWRGDVLLEAGRRVRDNAGVAGVDGQSTGEIEERGVGEYLKEIQAGDRADFRGGFRSVLVNLSRGRESFTFLGWTVRKRRSIQRNPRWHFVQRWPAHKAMKRIRERVHELTEVRGRRSRNVGEVIQRLNPVLRGWGTLRWQWRRGGQRTRFRFDRWPRERLYGTGLHRLKGTVKYPKAAAPRMPCQKNSPVSCVREIRTHSLKGGAGNGSR
jgi:hypothetical protein